MPHNNKDCVLRCDLRATLVNDVVSDVVADFFHADAGEAGDLRNQPTPIKGLVVGFGFRIEKARRIGKDDELHRFNLKFRRRCREQRAVVEEVINVFTPGESLAGDRVESRQPGEPLNFLVDVERP